MTESEWLVCADPGPMLAVLPKRTRDRKFRLFACACVQEYLHFSPAQRDYWMLHRLDISERYADGLVSREEWLLRKGSGYFRPWNTVEAYTEAWLAINVAINAAGSNQDKRIGRQQKQNETHRLATILRCVFGNPFVPVSIDPRWLTSTVVDLANVIYLGKAFDRMPILADALMDAGCDNEEVIQHCRGKGPAHSRLLGRGSVVEEGVSAMTEKEWIAYTDPPNCKTQFAVPIVRNHYVPKA